MTDRRTDQFGTPDQVFPPLNDFPVAAATSLDAGKFVATNASGYAVAVTASTAIKLWGRCELAVDNSAGAAGDKRVLVRSGVFFFDSGTGADAITIADVGNLCWASDGNTVNKTNAAGTRPAAGTIVRVDPVSGQIGVFVGMPSLYAENTEIDPSGTTAFRARNIVTGNVASLAAFTVAGNDGVTNAENDVVILAAQTTAAQNGPYVVGAVAGGAAPLTRPDWWPTGATLKSGVQIKVGGEGTVYKNTTWQAMVAADGFVIGTTDPKLYPLKVSGQTALVAGTFTISCAVFSVKSTVNLARTTANTSTSTTGGYHPTVAGATGITAGVHGVGAVVVQACVAAGTINAADISTLNWEVCNQP